MIARRLLIATSAAIKTIEDTLAQLDPINHDFHPPNDTLSIGDCDFPYPVKDPLALVRALRGDAFTQRLEYEDNLEHTLYVLTDCFAEALARRGKSESDLYLEWSDDNDDHCTDDDDDHAEAATAIDP